MNLSIDSIVEFLTAVAAFVLLKLAMWCMGGEG